MKVLIACEEMEREFEVGENMINDTCPICKKKFKLKEKIILCPIQKPKGDYFIDAVALPIHTKCYYVKRRKKNENIPN